VGQDLIISATNENINFDCRASSEDQVVRLQYLVAYLLEKNEQLRHTIAIHKARVLPQEKA